MHLRIALLTAVLVPAAQQASAEFPLCKLLHHHHHRHDCCNDCQVHVHLCKPAESGLYQSPADAPAAAPQPSQQMLYSQVLPSTVGYTMPMMPMMSMPMMMPYPVQQASMGAPQQQFAPQQQQRDSACGGCEDRVSRLEDGVKNLSERMDRIELILENQTIAMERLHETLVKPKDPAQSGQ